MSVNIFLTFNPCTLPHRASRLISYPPLAQGLTYFFVFFRPHQAQRWISQPLKRWSSASPLTVLPQGGQKGIKSVEIALIRSSKDPEASWPLQYSIHSSQAFVGVLQRVQPCWSYRGYNGRYRIESLHTSNRPPKVRKHPLSLWRWPFEMRSSLVFSLRQQPN